MRVLFWGTQGVVALGVTMLVAGLVIEGYASASSIVTVLMLPIGLMPVLGPVWIVVTPILLVLMLLTRNHRGPAGNA